MLKVVKELRYHPNLQARSLAGGKSQTLGLIVSNLENPFSLDIFRAFESDAHQKDCDVLVANTDYSPRRLVSSIQLMMGRRVVGLAAIVSEMDPSLMKEFAELNLPLVLYDVGAPATMFIPFGLIMRKVFVKQCNTSIRWGTGEWPLWGITPG